MLRGRGCRATGVSRYLLLLAGLLFAAAGAAGAAAAVAFAATAATAATAAAAFWLGGTNKRMRKRV